MTEMSSHYFCSYHQVHNKLHDVIKFNATPADFGFSFSHRHFINLFRVEWV